MLQLRSKEWSELLTRKTVDGMVHAFYAKFNAQKWTGAIILYEECVLFQK